MAPPESAPPESAPPESADSPVPYTVVGVGEKTVRKLVEAGFATLELLKDASAEKLSEIPGVGQKTAEKILTAARGETPAAENPAE